MKKLMFMINSLYGGGAERVLQTLLANLDYGKYDVTLYSMHREEYDITKYPSQVHYKVVFDMYNGNSKIAKNIYDFFAKIKGKLFIWCSSELFYRLFIRGKYDVEIAFIEGESTKIISGSSNKNSKKLAWVHIDLLNNPWTDFLYKNVQDEQKHYEKFDQILCVSDSVRSKFLEKYRIEGRKVATQYNPIDRDEILKKAEEYCPLPPKTKTRMLAVGRLVEQKGFDRLIRIASRLKQAGYNFELFILGEGKMRDSLEEMIRSYELEEMVQLIGFSKNPYPYMVSSDLLVCSSRTEGFSTVATEAVVLGVPVVSTDCAGVRELFGESQCGMIVENDEDALYQALSEVLLQPEELLDIQAQAKRRGVDFSLENRMMELYALFE